jgi:asparagine synthase (glutamine-hydrolysing)
MVRSPGQAPPFARSFFGRNLDPDDPAMSHRPRWDSTSALRSLLADDLAAEMPGSTEVADSLIARMPPESKTWNSLSRAQWLEMTTLLAGYILSSQGDRMLMANSVEGRFPFLDRDVVALCNGMPARHKLFGLVEKHVLKHAFTDQLPASVLSRDKQPYRAPDASSFFADGKKVQWFSELTSPSALASAGVYDPGRVTRLIDKCARTGGARLGNTDNMRLVMVASTQLLHADLVVGGVGDTPPMPPQPMLVIDLKGRNSSHA